MSIVSAIGPYDENYGSEKCQGLKTSICFTNLEHVMLTAIVKECRGCISSEGVDCFHHGTTSCHFREVREIIGLDDIESFDHLGY